jgi:hypothetical protein
MAGRTARTRAHGLPRKRGVGIELIGGRLARAQRDDEAILRSKPDSARAEAWADKVHDLIAAGLGDAEAELFLSNHDLGIGLRSPTDTDADVWMRRRLQRLSRLLDRIHSMPARIDFDPTRWGLGRANGPATRG